MDVCVTVGVVVYVGVYEYVGEGVVVNVDVGDGGLGVCVMVGLGERVGVLEGGAAVAVRLLVRVAVGVALGPEVCVRVGVDEGGGGVEVREAVGVKVRVAVAVAVVGVAVHWTFDAALPTGFVVQGTVGIAPAASASEKNARTERMDRTR